MFGYLSSVKGLSSKTFTVLMALSFGSAAGKTVATVDARPNFDAASMFSQQVAVIGVRTTIPVTVNPDGNTDPQLISVNNLPFGAKLSGSFKNAQGQWQAFLTWTPSVFQRGKYPITFTLGEAGQANPIIYTINVTVIKDNSVIKRIMSIRPKLMSVGNSINVYNRLGQQGGGNTWGADGHLIWFHARTHAAFDRARSHLYNWTGGGGMDAFGCYGFGGAVLNAEYPQNKSILAELPQAFANMIDTPDIVYLGNLLENDLGQGYTPAIMEGALVQTINLIQSQWPQALIIIATPSPSQSYNTPVLHQNVAAITAYIQALPATYDNLLVEDNSATRLAGSVDQPDPGYVVDVIHPNERGAFVRGAALYAQYGWLFPNALQIPATAYNSQTPAQSYEYNPVFTATGGVAQYPWSVAGLSIDYQYNSYEWYLAPNFTANVSQISPAGGLNITLGASGPVSSQNGVVFDTDFGSGYFSGLPQLNPGNHYFGAMQVRVVNPANLFGFGFQTNFIGGAQNILTAARFEGAFLGKHPEGLSDLFKPGDSFTFVTPTATPGSGYSTAVNYGFVWGTGSMVAGDATTYPSVQILAQNLINAETTTPAFAPEMPARQTHLQNQPFNYKVIIIPDAQTSNVLLTATGLPDGATLSAPVPVNGRLVSTFSWKPAAGQAGQTFPVTFIAQDNLAGAATVEFNASFSVLPLPIVVNPHNNGSW